MHKSFRLCRVEIPGWHSRRLFGGSTDEYFRGKARATTDVLKRTVLLFKPETFSIARTITVNDINVFMHVAEKKT